MRKKYSPEYKGFVLFIISILAIIFSFLIESNYSCLLWFFLFPLFYGCHAAVHRTLIPLSTFNYKKSVMVNEVLLMLGYSLQLMNFQLIRPAHIHHHIKGRHDETSSFDVLSHKPKLIDYIRYYTILLFAPSLYWQIFGFVYLVFPKLKKVSRFNYSKDTTKIPYWTPQLIIAGFIVFALYFGGIIKFGAFFICLTLMWNLLQNVSHYGLKGYDEFSTAICANTYIVSAFFRLLTYGSLSHVMHHAEMNIPGEYLHKEQLLRDIENKIGYHINKKIGFHYFLFDVFKQLKGPKTVNDLKIEWLKYENVI